MRRLAGASAVLALLLTSGCRRDEKIKLEPTDESGVTIASTVSAADPNTAMQLTRGFHALEQNAWRWTMGRFAVTLQPPPGAAERGATLILKFSLPEALFQKEQKATLSATIQKREVGNATYTKAGEYTFEATVPASLLTNEAVSVEFSIQPFLAAGSVDNRELGVIFVSAGLQPK